MVHTKWVGECRAQRSLWNKCTKWMCKALGQVWEVGTSLGGQESWGDAAMTVMAVLEALPFCRPHICFNILCFFPDWNHLNCICRGLYRLINIVTPLGALVFCDSTARVKESTQQTLGPSFHQRGPSFTSWDWVGRAPQGGRAGAVLPYSEGVWDLVNMR